MKKLFILLLLLTGIANAQIINIPDTNFKAILISQGYDTNNDGQIQSQEAISIYNLDVSNSNIVSLVGIRSFLNLVGLNCSNNQIANLNLQNLNFLTSLTCSFNNITTLNLSGTSLISLYCQNNQLTNLNVSNLVNLKNLFCQNNLLTSINFGVINNVNYLNCSYNLLVSLNVSCFDIGGFVYQELDCSYNQLTSLIIGQNIPKVICKNNLLSSLDYFNRTIYSYLDCSYNQLINLNITNSSFYYLDCKNNSLTALDLTGISTDLPTAFGLINNNFNFDCSFNQLTNLTFNNTQLSYFKCSNNFFTNLDFSGCTSVNYTIECSNNQLISINFGSNVKSANIVAVNNLLSTIDISSCKLISNLDVSNNNLTTIFAKNGRNEFIDFTSNPNLVYICADDEQVSALASVALPTTSINSYCNFVPGGVYNTISGISRFDGDNNGCSPLDLGFNNLRINITDGIDSGATFTNGSGNYSLFTQSLDYTLTPVLENPLYFNISPTTSAINFATNNFLTNVQDFCVTANGIHNDLEIIFYPVAQAVPGSEAEYILVYKNKGNQLMSGNVSLNFNDDITDFVSAIPIVDVQSVNNLSWNYANLLPFESRTINFKLNINSTLQTPPVNFGTLLAFEATVNPVLNDDTPVDNVFSFNQIASNVYLPHNITCLEGDNLPSSAIGNYLHYSVQFDNTGTAISRNIVVRQVIDAAKFDINTLQVISATASMRTVITNNIVEFIFENINLSRSSGNPPVGGHGDVLFKIKTKPTLTAGSSVMNTAGIYFDYNFPINTNMATTTFATLSNSVFLKDDTISVFPNPTNSIVNLNSKTEILTIELYDVQGRILETLVGNNRKLDISDKSNGIYFLKITTEKGSKVERIIKE